MVSITSSAVPAASFFGSRMSTTFVLFGLLVFTSGPTSTMAQTTTVTPIEKYFLPMGEDAILASMDAVNTAATQPLNSMNSITIAASGTIIWYDHWEDGYEISIVAPTQSTTQIWGDNNAANGCAPGVDPCTNANDYLNKGTALVLENYIPLPRDSANFYYDGGDVIQASFPIAVTRGVHSGPENGNPGALLGGAVEVSNTKSWGQNFRCPVGQGMTNDVSNAFTLTDLYIQASEANTVVTRGGVSSTIGQGETLRFQDIGVGELVTTSKPAQADLVTGEIGSSYEMRWYSLLPQEQWTNDYYTPLSETRSRVWLYNPNSFQITVDVYQQNDPDGSPTESFNIDPNGHTNYQLPNETSGYRFQSTYNFYGLTQTDDVTDGSTSGSANDWGHPLLPATSLTSKVIVGLAYGCKNNACPADTVNPPNPVWITASDAAIIKVDYYTDGTLVETFAVDKLESLIVQGKTPEEDPDRGNLDMTGATISALDASGNEVDIAVAWGQKHDWTLAETYNLDMGTVINPLPYISAFKSCELVSDNDGDGKISPGDELRCTIRVTNTGQLEPQQLQFCEDLSTNVTYSLGSTTRGANDTAIADPTGNFTSTLDPDCLLVDYSPGVLPVGGADSISYNITINDLADLPNGLDVIEDSGTILSGDGTEELATFDSRIQLELTPAFEFHKTVSSSGTCPGTDTAEVLRDGTATFCFEIVNTGNTALTGVTITDPQLGTQSPISYGGTIDIGESWITSATVTATADMTNTASADVNPSYPDGMDISYFEDLKASDTASFTVYESAAPTSRPSERPSYAPSLRPSSRPSATPSVAPSVSMLPTVERTPDNTICKQFSMTAVEGFVLSSFAFNLNYNGCVSVQVEYRINGGLWEIMCMSHDVYGQAPDRTIVDGDSCIEITVLAGETVEFRLSTEPSNTCTGTGMGSYNLYGAFLQPYYTYTQEECVMP